MIFFRRQRIDWIERSYNYAELVGLGAKRTDATRHIQDSFPNQITRLKQEIAAMALRMCDRAKRLDQAEARVCSGSSHGSYVSLEL